MIQIQQHGVYRQQYYTADNDEAQERAFNARVKDGELEIRNKHNKLIWCIRYNNTALIVNLRNKTKQKAYFEIYQYINEIENLVCKVDYMPQRSDMIGLKFKPSDNEMYIYRKNSTWFEIIDKNREIQGLIHRADKEYAEYTINSYDKKRLIFHSVLALLIDSIWFVHRYENYRIDYNTNLVNQKAKPPKIGAFTKAKKELFNAKNNKGKRSKDFGSNMEQ